MSEHIGKRERGAIRVEDLTKVFTSRHHRVPVLDGVSFEIPAGGAMSLVGPSGSGKSTLLHVLGTLEPPTAGRVSIDDVEPTELAERYLASFRNRHIGFVFQDHHLLPQLTVLQNVLLPTLVSTGKGAGSLERRAARLVDAVGLAERQTHRPAELSGGERQRVAIARALVNQPSVVLCDEPTGNLDSTTAQSIADLLFELHREEGSSLVVVTHNLELAERFPMRLRLEAGKCSRV